MYPRVSAFAVALVIVLSISLSACEDRPAMLGTSPTAAASRFESRLISVEPARIAPELLPNPFCREFPPFQMRFDLVFHTERDLVLRQLRFEFLDRSGGRMVPRAIPTSPAVPIPGTRPFQGTVGLVLNFGCGVPAEGTLFIDVETADHEGVVEVSHLRVRVG
jgi:hypothetical protein